MKGPQAGHWNTGKSSKKNKHKKLQQNMGSYSLSLILWVLFKEKQKPLKIVEQHSLENLK